MIASLSPFFSRSPTRNNFISRGNNFRPVDASAFHYGPGHSIAEKIITTHQPGVILNHWWWKIGYNTPRTRRMGTSAGGRQIFVNVWDVGIHITTSTLSHRVRIRTWGVHINRNYGTTFLLLERVMRETGRIERSNCISSCMLLSLLIILCRKKTSWNFVGVKASIIRHGWIETNNIKQATHLTNSEVMME